MPQRAPWVIADIATPQPMFTSMAAQTADVEHLRRRGYTTVFEHLGYVVLRKD